jgi:hypothetical protein
MYYIDLPISENISDIEISGDSLRQLLCECFRRSDMISLTDSLWANTTGTMKQELEPFALQKLLQRGWFGYWNDSEEDQRCNPLTRILYPASEAVFSVVVKYAQNIWAFADAVGNKQSLEDICFFSNGKLILGTVQHEYICRAFPPDDAFRELLLSTNIHWRYSEDMGEQMRVNEYLPSFKQ